MSSVRLRIVDNDAKRLYLVSSLSEVETRLPRPPVMISTGLDRRGHVKALVSTCGADCISWEREPMGVWYKFRNGVVSGRVLHGTMRVTSSGVLMISGKFRNMSLPERLWQMTRLWVRGLLSSNGIEEESTRLFYRVLHPALAITPARRLSDAQTLRFTGTVHESTVD